MQRFSMNLPPMAPDYSGACSALFNLDSTIVIHDASGCTGNYTCFDEPRWYGSRKPVYCSSLRKMDAVFGNEQKLLDRITRAWEVQHSQIVAMVGSPVPMVIGTDFDGVAREIEQRTGAAAFGFFTNGTQFYPVGVSQACIAAIERFADIAPEKLSGAINILGVTPLDMGRGNLDALRAALEKAGFTINCCCATDWSMDELKRIGCASVNLAATQAGVEIACHMEKKFATPYVCGLPVGDKATDELISRIHAALNGREYRQLPEWHKSRDALVLGDWAIAASICRALELEHGITAEPVSLFGRTGLPEGARALDDEESIENALSGAKFVISDPLVCALAPNGAKTVSIPQYAVSSRLSHERLFIDRYFDRLMNPVA